MDTGVDGFRVENDPVGIDRVIPISLIFLSAR